MRAFGDMLRVFAAGADPARDEAIAELLAKDVNPVLGAAFDATEPATVLGHEVRVVSRGALVALKFHAAVSPTRRIEDRYQDVADIGRIIARGFEPADQATAERIAGLSYPGASADLATLLNDLRNGRPVKL